MRTLQVLNQEITEKNAELGKKFAAAEAAEGDEKKALVAEISALGDEVEALDAELEEAKKFYGAKAAQEQRAVRLATVVSRPAMPTGQADAEEAELYAVPRHVSERDLTSFKSGTLAERTERAFRFGHWFMGVQMGNAKSLEFCRTHGVQILAANEGNNAQGGAIVPVEFGTDIIDLREQYGVFQPNAKNEKMNSDTKIVPRRTGGLTAYFVGEGQTITDSTKGWNDVQLTARKIAVLAKISSELNEDAIIAVANDVMKEIAYAESLMIDQCGFIGDGTSTYGGIVGVTKALLNLSGTISYIAGLRVGSGNGYDELTLTDFNGTKALLPQYANTPETAWYCHQSFYSNVMEKLMLAAGGVTAQEIAQGRRQPLFMGYPVRVTQVMPSVAANSQVCCLFGDLSLAALFGDRRQNTMAVDQSLFFAQDQLAIRGTARFDINVHDVGNASSTDSQKVAGPVVGLVTAAS